MSDTIEKTYLQLDSVKLTGLTSEYDQFNATSKAYVDDKVTSAINALVDGAADSMNTLKEIATALNNNPSIASVLTSQISSVSSSLTSEAVARTDAEAVLRAAASTEVTNRTAADDILREAINNEVSNREYEITRVENAYSSTDTVLFGKIEEVKTELLNESILRASEDIRVIDMLNVADNLINDRLNDLSMQLENEGTTRSNADVELSTRCDDLVTDIFNEKSERKSEDVLIRASIVAVNEDLIAEGAERSTGISALQSSKFNKSGGDVTGSVKLVDSYLNFGDSWRVKASGDGLRIVFEHLKNGVWRTALPFICSA